MEVAIAVSALGGAEVSPRRAETTGDRAVVGEPVLHDIAVIRRIQDSPDQHLLAAPAAVRPLASFIAEPANAVVMNFLVNLVAHVGVGRFENGPLGNTGRAEQLLVGGNNVECERRDVAKLWEPRIVGDERLAKFKVAHNRYPARTSGLVLVHEFRAGDLEHAGGRIE